MERGGRQRVVRWGEEPLGGGRVVVVGGKHLTMLRKCGCWSTSGEDVLCLLALALSV